MHLQIGSSFLAPEDFPVSFWDGLRILIVVVVVVIVLLRMHLFQLRGRGLGKQLTL